MGKKKSITEALDDYIGHKKERKKQREKPKEPITSEQIEDVQGELCYLADEIAFLQEVFRDTHMDLEPHHATGLSKILEHVHADSYKVLDLLDELESQAVDK